MGYPTIVNNTKGQSIVKQNQNINNFSFLKAFLFILFKKMVINK